MQLQSIVRNLSRHWLTVGFFLGFITDVILLNRVDDLFDNLVLLFYVVLATLSLVLLYYGVAERMSGRMSYYLRRYSPLVMQYAFGGLLSGMLIFYGRSGDWLSNAPFLLLILAVVFGNEFVKKRSDRLVYHLALYFIGLFSYVVLVVPVITGHMGDAMFLASGFLSLSLLCLVIKLLYQAVPRFITFSARSIIVTIGSVYIGFNLLYFIGLIPPIPLSLTELEIVQFVEKFPQHEQYRIIYEDQPWYSVLPFIHPTVHPTRDAVYCFSRVYTPTRVTTNIFHRWEYKDSDGHWQQSFLLGFPIAGTNKTGYRGYTEIGNFFSGTWRCSVETKRGQVLGRTTVVIDTKGAANAVVEVIE